MDLILRLASQFGPFVFGFVLGYFLHYLSWRAAIQYDPLIKRFLANLDSADAELRELRKRILEREALYFGLLRTLATIALQKLGQDALTLLELYASQKRN